MHVKEPTSFIRKELGNNPGVVVRQAKQVAIYSGGEAYIQVTVIKLTFRHPGRDCQI